MSHPELQLRPITVFVLDDHELVVRGLIEMVEAEGDMSVVGSAATEQEAIDGIAATHPDVAILDVRLEHGSGFTVCREVSRRVPSVAPMLFTSVNDDRVLIDAYASGAVAVCQKTDRPHHIIATIRDVAGGIDLLHAREVEAATAVASDLGYPLLDTLTEQEHQIAALIGRGWSNRQIAAEIFLAEKTVKNYVSTLLAKLEVSRRSEVAALAARVEEREAAWRLLRRGITTDGS